MLNDQASSVSPVSLHQIQQELKAVTSTVTSSDSHGNTNSSTTAAAAPPSSQQPLQIKDDAIANAFHLTQQLGKHQFSIHVYVHEGTESVWGNGLLMGYFFQPVNHCFLLASTQPHSTSCLVTTRHSCRCFFYCFFSGFIILSCNCRPGYENRAPFMGSPTAPTTTIAVLKDEPMSVVTVRDLFLDY